ncbi:MAG: hypothetical protein BRD25_02605 [Bacteroidetes bacterium QH_1_61_8]|nr:MAG: hypothetical protein BRD25_02605 [Bacteroidetes bacterium QH_1_61_8]
MRKFYAGNLRLLFMHVCSRRSLLRLRWARRFEVLSPTRRLHMFARYRYLFFSLLVFGVFCVAMPDAAAQSTGTVEGRVVDANDGTPLPGANVAVEGTSIGTSTNEDGRYALSGVPTGSQTIRVSFVGYEKAEKTLEVRSGETTSLNVKLKSQITEAGEVVVTGIRKNQMRSINQKRQAANVMYSRPTRSEIYPSKT